MPKKKPDWAHRAAAAARAYVEGGTLTRQTRANSRPPRQFTIREMAARFNTKEALVKKYIRLLKAGLALPKSRAGGAPMALTKEEEKAIITYAQRVEGSTFALTEACLINLANFLRRYRSSGPVPNLSRTWIRRFKERHPEIRFTKAKIKEIRRAGAELEVIEIEEWFKEYEAVTTALSIQPANLWNFDETPLQIGWMKGSIRLVSTRMKKNLRPISFQPGNKESLTSVDAVSAAGRVIPSFLILSAKVLLEDYAMASIDEDTVITQTTTGFNNAQRALQWLQHFNRHSFAQSDSFAGFSIETWFGYAADITRASWEKTKHRRRGYIIRKTKAVYRLLLMDGFAAHEDPEFIWYCELFDIIPFKIPAHTSHFLQPLDVGVYQHLKRQQQKSLRDFVLAGGTNITRYDFLCQWNEMAKAAFKACYIYVGFEQTGLWPKDPKVILSFLRQSQRQQQEALLPDLLAANTISPRSVKRASKEVKKKLEILSSPTRAVISNAFACLDYAIIADSQNKHIRSLQERRMQHEARRTKTLRRIQGIGDGAFTVAQLRNKIAARQQQEAEIEARHQIREQQSWMKQQRAEEAAKLSSTPRLRGRAAANEKKRQEREFQAYIQSQHTQEDKDILENYTQLWNKADDDHRFLLWRTMPKSILSMMPEAALWAEAVQNNTKIKGNNNPEVEEDDYNTISLEAGYLTMPSSDSEREEEEESSDEDSEVEITTTSSRTHTTSSHYFDIPRIPQVGLLDDDQENKIREEIDQELRAFRAYSSSSDEDPFIVIGGRRICVPRTRARPTL